MGITGRVSMNLKIAAIVAALSAGFALESEAKTGFVNVPASAFIPDGENTVTGYGYENSWSGGLYSDEGCFNAPIYLPDGSTISQLKIYYQNNSSQESKLYLYKTKKSSEGNTELLEELLDGDAGSTQSEKYSISEVVNSKNNGYFIGICLNDAYLYYVRVKYSS